MVMGEESPNTWLAGMYLAMSREVREVMALQVNSLLLYVKSKLLTEA
jgi:hypothetical protein